jgi:uncharacterized protein (DUF433 family)
VTFTRITVDPKRTGGMPCVRNLRFPVATVVAMVAGGMTLDEILDEHPDLDADDIAESVRYAAQVIQERGATASPAGVKSPPRGSDE